MIGNIIIGEAEVAASDYSYPDDRVLRSAWALDEGNKVIFIDMAKAKDVWRDKIREARKQPLLDLDMEYMRALEVGADTSQIVSQKQALRDAPADPAIDAATTPAELKLVQPAGLQLD